MRVMNLHILAFRSCISKILLEQASRTASQQIVEDDTLSNVQEITIFAPQFFFFSTLLFA